MILSTSTFKLPYLKTINSIEGGVMQELMPKVRGKAEGAVVSKIVKELLAPEEEI